MSVAERMRRAILRKGGTVSFTRVVSGGEYDPGTGETSPQVTEQDTAPAVEDDGDPDHFAAQGLTLRNPVTLIVPAADLSTPPAPGQTFEWAGVTYTVQAARPTSLNGSPIAWRVTGST